MDNFLSASSLIIQRLCDTQVADSKKIRPAPSAGWVTENPLDASVAVIFFDDIPDVTPGGQARFGRSQASKQLWMVMVSSRNVSDSGNAARNDAGVILQQILVALQGFSLSDKHGPLYREKAPYRATDNNGFVHIPLLFSTVVTVKGSAISF